MIYIRYPMGTARAWGDGNNMRQLYRAVQNHPYVKERPVVRQFVKFALVGVINTLTSTSVYLLATRSFGWHPLSANALAFVVAVTVSYVLNKRWTFRDPRRDYHRQYVQFFTVSTIGFSLSEGIIWLVHSVMGIHDLVAFGTAVVIVLFWNFTANRLWTFRRSGDLPS